MQFKYIKLCNVVKEVHESQVRNEMKSIEPVKKNYAFERFELISHI